MPAAKPDTLATGQPEGQVRSAEQFAAALPTALRVSSTSGHGVEQLKLGMLAMLEEHDLQQQQQRQHHGLLQQPGPEDEDQARNL